MSGPINIAVVGHTNAGKTSLLRTLTRRRDFGETSDRPGTTRHVEAIDLKIDGGDGTKNGAVVRFLDTPGLEDSVTLADYIKALPGHAPPDRVRAFLEGPEASGSFEQEAKVLRAMLEIDAAFYVIDTREAVLPKFRAEIELLASCARPVMPVLNFVRDAASRKAEWRATLAAYGLHAHVQFDAVAPFVGSERKLYQDLLTLLQDRRRELLLVIEDLDRQFRERRTAGCRIIAELLVGMAALRREISRDDIDLPARKTSLVQELKGIALSAMRTAIDDMLQVYGFRKEEADEAVLPWLEGRWESDLFNPETLKEAGKRLGAGAAVGAAIGLAADIASAGLSLGTGSMIGAALGGLASQGWSPFSRKIANHARGVHEVSLENEVLMVMAEHLLRLLLTLEQRGHAATGRIALNDGSDRDNSESLPEPTQQAMKNLVQAAYPARGHPEWDGSLDRKPLENAQRERMIHDLMSKAENVLATLAEDTY